MINIKFTTIEHETIKKLDVSFAEAVFLDAVFKRSSDPDTAGWSLDKYSEYAEFLGVTTRGLSNMIKRLCEKGLMESGQGSRLKITKKYYDIVVRNIAELPINNLKEEQFKTAFEFYPYKTQEEKSLKKFIQVIKTDEDYALFRQALKKYKLSDQVQRGVCMNFCNFLDNYKLILKKE